MRRTSPGFSILSLVLIGPAWLIVGVSALTAQPSAEVLERFDISRERRSPVLVPLELQGKRLLFVLDTGTTTTIYDSSLTNLLGKEVGSEELILAEGSLTLKLYQSPEARMGKLKVGPGLRVLVADLQSIRAAAGEDIFGILGMDFLRNHIVRIDRDRGEVAFLRSLGTDPGKQVPIEFDHSAPFVEVCIPALDDPQKFLVDTGSVGFSSCSLRAEIYETLSKKGAIKKGGHTMVALPSGVSAKARGRLDAIQWAGNRHEHLLVDKSNGDFNTLGLNYLSRYVMTFDFPGAALFVKRGKQFEEADLEDNSGLHVLRDRRGIVVSSVEVGSPAALAGMRSGDSIFRVDGKNDEQIKIAELRRCFCSEGKAIRLSIRRDGHEYQVDLKLPNRRQTASISSQK